MINEIKKHLTEISVEKISDDKFIITTLFTHIFKGNPNFKFEIDKTSNGYKLSDIGVTYNTMKENGVSFENNISNKIYKVSNSFRCKIENSVIYSEFQDIEHLKYYLSYMIEFISIINYYAYGENMKNIEISK